MNIHYTTPYRSDKDLGRAYNEAIAYTPPHYTHVCLMDGDIMFLTPNWGTIIEEYVALHPDAVLTCKTNRIHAVSKQLDRQLMTCVDVEQMIGHATDRSHLRIVTPILPGEGMSGFLMVVPVTVWERVKFVEGIGCLGVDSQFRIDLHNAGVETLIMDGLLVWHTYRLGHDSKKHLV